MDPDESTQRKSSLEVEEPMLGDDNITQAQFHQLLGIDDYKQKKTSAEFILKLKALKGLPQVAVHKVIHGFQGVFTHAIARVKAGLQERLA